MDGRSPTGPLPETYANALLMRDRGVEADAIAAWLDVPCEAMDSFLRVAEAKLERALAAKRGPGEGASG